MTRICRSCLVEKPISQFYTSGVRNGQRYRRYKCRVCYRNKESQAFRCRLWKHGLTLDQFHSIMERQDFLCAICLEYKDLDVDHCHRTGKVRGLLCRQCNHAIGLFSDDSGRLTNAVAYLSKESKVVSLRDKNEADQFSDSIINPRAAKDTGRPAIGIEIEERYREIAAKRLSQGVLPLEVTS